MKLIDEIIELLGSGESNLTTALLKTKILMHKLGEKESSQWVDGELKGYPDKENLPDYRILSLTVRGDFSNGYYRHNSQTLPTMHLDKEIKEGLETDYLRKSIAVVEEYSKKDGQIQMIIAPEYYSMLSKALGDGYNVERAWRLHSAGAMTQVKTEVTSRLLDFVLELSEKFPDEPKESEIKELSKELGVSDLFKNAVFGDNVSIVVGDSNTQEIKNTVEKNNLTSLEKMLRENGVAEEDISELSVAVEADKKAGEAISENSFGSNVSNWIGSMMSKAATTSWDINVGAAGSLLATAIGRYYGF